MTVEDFDQFDPAAETYPRRSAKRRRRTIRIRFTGPIALISLGLFIATLLIGGVVGSWLTGSVETASARDHLIVIGCMVAAMSYFTGREWLSEKRRERGEAERLATVMVWHTDRADENEQILTAVRALSAAEAKTCDCYSELGELRDKVATQGGTLAAVEHQISAAVTGAFNPATSATIHNLNRELNGHRPL